MEKYIFSADEASANVRIDKFLNDRFQEITRSSIQKLISENNVLVNGKNINKNYKVGPSDEISVSIPDPTPITALPEDIPLDIVYEDEDLIVVNKPKGMVVHPAAGNYTGTLVNALLYHCKDSLSGINGELRPGIVHRIDKNTSGLLIVAKSDFAHKKLALQIKEHSFTRRYEAVAYGNLKTQSGVIDAPIGRHSINRKQMAVTEKNSRNAVTHYKVLEANNGFTHIELELETGRTHQIRVHMAYIGHPLAGDDVYGPKKVIKELNGQCLHAKTIGFIHPKTNRYMEFSSELPEYFKKFLKSLEMTVNL